MSTLEPNPSFLLPCVQPSPCPGELRVEEKPQREAQQPWRSTATLAACLSQVGGILWRRTVLRAFHLVRSWVNMQWFVQLLWQRDQNLTPLRGNASHLCMTSRQKCFPTGGLPKVSSLLHLNSRPLYSNPQLTSVLRNLQHLRAPQPAHRWHLHRGLPGTWPVSFFSFRDPGCFYRILSGIATTILTCSPFSTFCSLRRASTPWTTCSSLFLVIYCPWSQPFTF